ncbi:MAG: hypothetical protein ACE5DN_00855 [Flavobacteriales bacterium]
MEDKINFSGKLKILSYLLLALGIVALAVGFFQDPGRAWANVLLNNYYFISLVIGATFFFAIQYITQSGWSAMFRRVPEAIGSFMPVGAILMLLMLIGLPSLYEWSHTDAVSADELLQHKSPYLNVPFFIIRMIIFTGVWILFIRLFRKLSVREDLEGGTDIFNKTEFFSKVFIFVMAITFSLATFDWVMSTEPHWFSTVFAFRNVVSSFYHASAVITIIVLLLNANGHFKLLNKYHLQDFARYMFALGIIWAYLWFVEYLLIWFANIPEETIYFIKRREGDWNILFLANIIINWILPFLILLPIKADRSKAVLYLVCTLLIIGQWIDVYLQVMPGTSGALNIGFVEIGTFLGFAGLFMFVVARSLASAPLIPKNHPYLEESMYHQF